MEKNDYWNKKLEGIMSLIYAQRLDRIGIGKITTTKRNLTFALFFSISVPDRKTAKDFILVLQKIIRVGIPPYKKSWSNGGSKENQEKEIQKDFPMDMINH